MKTHCASCNAFIDESEARYEKQGNYCDDCTRKINQRAYALQRREQSPKKGSLRYKDYEDIRQKFFPTRPLNNDGEVLG